MNMRPGFPPHKISIRAEAILEELEFHFQAETIEALLAPRGSRAKTSRIAALFDQVGETSDRQRRAIARRLMERNINTGAPLSARDAARLRKVIDPRTDVPLVQRSGVNERLRELLPEAPETMEDPRQVWEFVRSLLPDFLPEGLRANPEDSDNDGRPDDAEPGDPPPEDGDGQVGTGQEVLGPWPQNANPVPYTRLDFVIEEVLCLDSTNGEAGRDEISISGLFTQFDRHFNPGTWSTGRSESEVAPIQALGRFRDGENFTGLTTPFHSFDLTGWQMPCFATATVFLAETDPGGGFQAFVDAAASPVPPPSSDSTESLIYALQYSMLIAGGLMMAGAVALGPFGALGGFAIGVVIGVIWVYNALGGNRDEIFPPQTTAPQLVLRPAMFSDHPFYGATRSVTERLHFEVDGGAYDVFYHWELSEPLQTSPGDQDEAAG